MAPRELLSHGRIPGAVRRLHRGGEEVVAAGTVITTRPSRGHGGLLVRSNNSRATLLAEVAAAVRGVDANVPVVESRMLEDQTRLGFSIYDVAARILRAVAVAAVCLAALGVYGMVAYTIKQRMKDIGIRMAIGAAPANIRRRFITMGLRVGVAGVLTGVPLVLMTLG